MEGASLFEANMEGASLYRVRMEGASLHAVRMEGASLISARMQGAILDWALMADANLSGVRMEGVDFWVCDLSAALCLTTEQLAMTFGSGSVTLPVTLPRPAHWPLSTIEPESFFSELALWRASPSTYRPPQDR